MHSIQNSFLRCFNCYPFGHKCFDRSCPLLQIRSHMTGVTGPLSYYSCYLSYSNIHFCLYSTKVTVTNTDVCKHTVLTVLTYMYYNTHYSCPQCYIITCKTVNI